jgi:hypothetical protein
VQNTQLEAVEAINEIYNKIKKKRSSWKNNRKRRNATKK